MCENLERDFVRLQIPGLNTETLIIIRVLFLL